MPLTVPRDLAWAGGSGIVHLPIPEWPSGLYFVELLDSDGRRGYAPFVLRPRDPGQRRALVVLPTNTWGACNLRERATWYATPSVHVVDLTRPFIGGVPPHFRDYDLGFQRWFARTGKEAELRG